MRGKSELENEKWWKTESEVEEREREERRERRLTVNQRGKKSEQEGEQASVGRKQLYLHEAYLGSRLQNNGRKRVHGTFPCERACVPLIQGSRGPAPPCGQQRRHSLQGRWGWLTTGQGRVGGCRSTLFNDKKLSTNFPSRFLIVKAENMHAYLFF